MEIMLKLTIPDEDVAIAQENGPGPHQDVAEWICAHFMSESRFYFESNLEFRCNIEVASKTNPHP